MSLETTPEQIHELITAAGHVFLTQHITMAGLALMIWDHSITLQAEISLVWPAKLSPVKVLFLLNRYIPPIFITIDTANLIGSASWLSDKIWILLDIGVELLTVFAATFLIGMRVHILWDNRRDIFLWVSAAWVLHVVANIALVVTSTMKQAGSYTVQPMFNVCFGRVEGAWTVWIPAIIYHCFIMVLLVAKSLSTPRIVSTRVYDVVIRDGFIYFFVVFLAMLFNLLSRALAPSTLSALPRWVVWSICAVATSRLLLSLKGTQSAKQWDNAISLAREDIEMQPGNRVEFIFTKHEDDDNWATVALAFFLRYPNPFAAHVLSCDVIDRSFTSEGSLRTTRLILKRGNLPKWFPSGVVARSESWIVEESEVDTLGRRVSCTTRNLEHTKALRVIEQVTLYPLEDGRTLQTTEARFQSRFGWGLTKRIESYASSKFRSNIEKSRQGIFLVLNLLRESRMQLQPLGGPIGSTGTIFDTYVSRLQNPHRRPPATDTSVPGSTQDEVDNSTPRKRWRPRFWSRST
ncbi:hypothetical protein FRC11_011501 [Ceratobasidium sp. 423]|nr:hypothetical protein FRC11_011501 [Ceratobasidium sp. 423]